MYRFIYLSLSMLIFNSKLLAIDLQTTMELLSDDNFNIYIALFGLAIIGLFALYLSSEKAEVLEKEYKEKEQKNDQIHQVENEIASKMGKDIYNIVQDKHKNTQLIIMTTNLIDFLQIRSKKTQITNKELELSNLLNDVIGILKTNIRRENFQLFYDISTNISEKIISDTLNLSKILSNILIYSVEANSENLTLKIETDSFSKKDDQLLFIINTHLKIKVNIGDEIFSANYNDSTQSYESLSLFIAKELAILLNGDLVARNNKKDELEFILHIPYKPIETIDNKTTLLDTKNYIYIKDTLEASALHTQKILQELNQDVVIDLKDETIININNIKDKEILFIDEVFLTKQNIDILSSLDIQVVVYDNILKTSKDNNIDINHTKISKPFTIWQIINLLNTLHNKKRHTKKTTVNSGNAIVYKKRFLPTKEITLGSFVKFENKKILLVEDNIINQKVFCGILNKSKSNISIADNGQKALDILEKDSKFDIIFMDINMPVMDGYTASIKIRENSRYDDIPIVSLTALTSSEEIAKIFASGINAYLSKPLKKEILFSVLSIFIKDTKTIQKELKIKDEPLMELNGLDIKLGISKSASNEIFYKEILIEFVDAYKDSTKIMRKYIDDFRYEQLKIIALDIQGLSGTIGAFNLHKEVNNIVKSIVLKKHDAINEIIIQYDKELTILLNSITKYLK